MPHAVNPRALEPHFLRNVLDVLIIGAGPAGLSAAIALGRVRRSAIVFDSSDQKDTSNYYMQTSLANDHEIPPPNRDDMMAELKAKYKTVILASTVVKSVRERCMVFEVEDGTGRRWKGRKVILATGNRDIIPDIPGYQETWGKNIFDCLQCRGFEESSNKKAAVLLTSEDANSIDACIRSAYLSLQFAQDTTFLINGICHVEQHPDFISARKNGFGVNNSPIKSFRTTMPGSPVTVEFADGSTASYGLIFHRPRAVIVGKSAQQLDLEMTSAGQILIENEYQGTCKRGVFAAGECATTLKHESMAVGSGMLAGIGANLQIVEDHMSLSS
ncbi:hypothetical protein KAF25_003520 [Fusarium avenaceum]|uniref:FAD/NAD(P)-binding domain-containing protein n=1 Tax=Fusarium avenaceum TaxID=40199 RepID=A0A9P7KRM5_9HYPO|nr:hypothetical protein KAF25_003520 [Fusarium avenaceum]